MALWSLCWSKMNLRYKVEMPGMVVVVVVVVVCVCVWGGGGVSVYECRLQFWDFHFWDFTASEGGTCITNRLFA